ncbi:uncharacterized protein LOC123709143 isoform X2 [Pieris brassicae]|uniref:Hemolymph juvenile hormone binding protein n=1 Tax=Pieris brassicae TaxID=7116 RepID=A0A9P0SFM2_PIEBR|nr:uncharacterized protein LOC123709142 isoform X2 [Pieris brassicae]XP_045516252.1 uncharacterized protein LOC123709143 isoform X2 [Pieris brassicae]CAH3847603.1 unnamed protein product [Pieris brassicae]
MKFVVFACALLVASAIALPQKTNEVEPKEPRLITNSIRNIIRQVRNAIRANGLDPLIIDSYEFEYNVPFLVDVRLFLNNFSFTGASNIVIRQLDYWVFWHRLRFNIELPRLMLVVENSGLKANVFGEKYNGDLRGSLAINGIGLSGEVRVNFGIFSGISIRSVVTKFRIGRITSNVNLTLMEEDLSANVNKLFNEDIPYILKTYEAQINKFFNDTIRAILDGVLKPSYFSGLLNEIESY